MQVAYPHDDAGEFVREDVQLEAVKLARPDELEPRCANLLGERYDLLLKFLKLLHGDVQEVTAAARRV